MDYFKTKWKLFNYLMVDVENDGGKAKPVPTRFWAGLTEAHGPGVERDKKPSLNTPFKS